MSVTIEDLYEIANNELMKEFGINSLGEAQEANWYLNQDRVNEIFDADINGETVRSVMDTMIDELISMKLLYTKKAKYGIIEVCKR